MPNYQKAKDIFTQRKVVDGTFEEYPLVVQPNSVIVTDAANNLIMVTTASLIAGTGSIEFATSASYANTASYATNVPSTASLSNTASYLMPGANIYLSQSYIYSDINASVPDHVRGQLWWDHLNHTYTIDTLESRLQIGQENFIRVIAGEYLPNGTIVYLNGTDIDPHNPFNKLPIAWPALADGTELSASVVGVLTQELQIGDEGFVTTQGIVNDLNTFDFEDGAVIYLSSTQPGSFIDFIPPDPYEKIKIGTVLYSHGSIGRILVDISILPSLISPYIGMVTTASFTDRGNGLFIIGDAKGNFCTTPDGLSIIKQYTIPEMGFTASAGLYTQYVMAHYNSGSPSYMLSPDKSHVDEIQVISVYSFIYPDAGDTIGHIDWDSPGTLLANKLNTRIINLYGAQRETGLMIDTSGSVTDSRYITVTSGSMWYGVKRTVLTEINTSNTSNSPLSLQYHSASVWMSRDISSGYFINDMIDDGTNLQSASYGSYIVNYVYRTISDTNRTQIVLSKALATLTDAQIFTLPEPSPYFKDFSLLVGRIIVQSGSSVPISVDSAFGVGIPITVTPQHNDLQNIQGGTSSLNAMEYYHLTATEYAGSGTGLFVRQSGSVITGSISNAITASYALDTPASISASHAVQSDSSSYLNPGASFFVVSGSNGVPPAYIEPYDYSIDNVFRPPSKEGRTFWDHKWVNWKVWQDTNYSSSTAAALNINLGRETCIPIHNPSNVTLTRLTPVYISGSQTSSIYPFNQNWPTTYKPDVYAAEANGTNTKADVVGLVRNTIPPYHDGYVIVNGIMHNADVSAFGTIGTKLYLAPPGQELAYGITNIKPGQPYEVVNLGWVSEFGTGGGTQGSVIVKITADAPPLNAYAGVTSDIVITSDDSGSVIVSTGRVNLFDDNTGFGLAYGHLLAEKTLSLITGSTNYIVAEHSGSTEAAHYYLTTDATYANGINIVRVAQLDIYNETTSSWDVHQFDIGIVGLALANKLNNKDIKLNGFQRQNGLTLYTTGSTGEFGITSGIIWYGPNSHNVDPFDTTVGGNYTYIFNTTSSNGTASWHQHTSSIYLAGQYNSSSGVGIGDFGLDICAPNSWSVNFVYRIIGTTDEAAIVLSNAQYVDEITAAANATTPQNLPSTIRDQCLLIGRFIVQSGSYATTVVQSAFSTIFAASVVTNHESLTGIQGGTGGEHKHLTADEYTGTGTGVFVKTSNPTLVTPTFTGATPGHVPYWSPQQKLILTSSVIHIVSDEYVLINSGSVPDPLNPETLLVFQINTSSANIIGAYSNVNGFSQIYNQNFSTGSEASADIIAANDNGNQYVHYIDMGIASSNYNSPTWPWNKSNEGYLMMDGGNLWIGTTTTHSINFFFNNTASTDYADKTGFYLSGSWYGTASWANNATSASHTLKADSADAISFVANTAHSASWVSASAKITTADTASYILASNIDGTITSASYAISASWAPIDDAPNAVSSSWASSSISASYTTTASYAVGVPTIKSGIVAGATFSTTNPRTASIVFTKPFLNNNYSVVVTGENSRTWTIQSKVSGSFVINSNNAGAIANNTFWQAIQTGEYYS